MVSSSERSRFVSVTDRYIRSESNAFREREREREKAACISTARSVSTKCMKLAAGRNKISQQGAATGASGSPGGLIASMLVAEIAEREDDCRWLDRGVSVRSLATLAISCFSTAAVELNICRGETRVTSQLVAVSEGNRRIPKPTIPAALREDASGTSQYTKKRPISHVSFFPPFRDALCIAATRCCLLPHAIPCFCPWW